MRAVWIILRLRFALAESQVLRRNEVLPLWRGRGPWVVFHVTALPKNRFIVRLIVKMPIRMKINLSVLSMKFSSVFPRQQSRGHHFNLFGVSSKRFYLRWASCRIYLLRWYFRKVFFRRRLCCRFGSIILEIDFLRFFFFLTHLFNHLLIGRLIGRYDNEGWNANSRRDYSPLRFGHAAMWSLSRIAQ